MGLGTVGSEQRGEAQNVGRLARLAGIEVEQAEVQEQLPVIETETDSFLILGELEAMLADDAVGETEMVVGERVGGIVGDDDAMAANGLAIVFHPEEIV